MQLKNPWSYLRWKGNYSEFDDGHWTKKLQQLLGYNPKTAAQMDNGVFWIDYNSLLDYFSLFTVNWNPTLFSFSYAIHEWVFLPLYMNLISKAGSLILNRKWSHGEGIIAQTLGDNPQYLLTVQPGTGSIWVLLTTHITCLEDISQKREFIRLLVYLNNGKKVMFKRENLWFHWRSELTGKSNFLQTITSSVINGSIINIFWLSFGWIRVKRKGIGSMTYFGWLWWSVTDLCFNFSGTLSLWLSLIRQSQITIRFKSMAVFRSNLNHCRGNTFRMLKN